MTKQLVAEAAGTSTTTNPAYVLYPKQFGGGGGGAFDDWASHGSESLGKIVKIGMRGGYWTDSITIIYSGGISTTHGGGGGGPMTWFTLGPDEYITQVDGSYGQFVEWLQFTTNMGRTSPKMGGGNTSHTFQVQFNDGDGVLTAFTGTSGTYLDDIGFRYAEDPVAEVKLLDVVVTAHDIGAPTPAGATSAELTNRDPHLPASETADVSIVESGTVTITTGIAITTGVTLSAEAGIAGLVTAGVQFSFSATASYSVGKASTQTVGHSVKATAEVSPCASRKIVVTADRKTFAVSYTGTALITYLSGATSQVEITAGKMIGEYQGVDYTIDVGPNVPITPGPNVVLEHL